MDGDILLTSYGVARSDAEKLKKKRWQVVVIDEAQNIKNKDAAQSRAVKSIGADIRIAMSGTPVENRLGEFWSIMDYTNKGYLGSTKSFKENYADPIQIANDARVAEKFRDITANPIKQLSVIYPIRLSRINGPCLPAARRHSTRRR